MFLFQVCFHQLRNGQGKLPKLSSYPKIMSRSAVASRGKSNGSCVSCNQYD